MSECRTLQNGWYVSEDLSGVPGRVRVQELKVWEIQSALHSKAGSPVSRKRTEVVELMVQQSGSLDQ
jgi:hypothetical protein